MSKLLDSMALLGYCSFIFFLSAQQNLPVPPVFEFQDKLLHSGAYFVMGVFSWRTFRHFNFRGQRLALISGLFCSVYGLSDEWHQSFVPGRSTSGWDWLADSFGAALAAYVMYRLSMTRQAKAT